MNKTQNKPSILIVDDDKNTRDGLNRALRRSYSTHLAESAEVALNILNDTTIDILLTDLRMPGTNGLTLMQRALAQRPEIICILLTAYGNVETAVEAMKRGAYDFLTKPVNLDHLDILLKRAMHSRSVESENANLREQLDSRYGLENIIGNSPAMQQIFDIIQQAAPTQATILIQGPSGTGKELVAHAIHQLSTRSKGALVAVNCAALTPTLLESELFGHEKGAYTGAASRRHGRFETADGGTLFLDEVGEIDTSTQIKLLRVLEERKFERVGGNQTVDVDIRLIAASNKDLRELVKNNKFREDLFFRLDVVNINLPSLKDRAGDIPLLCNHFLKELSEKNSKPIDSITPETINILSSYSWPGNVRELRNTIEKMIVLARSNKLSARDIPQNIRAETSTMPTNTQSNQPTSIDTSSIADAEKQMIENALLKNDNNRTKTAQELGISRRTLHRKLNKYKADKKIN